MTAADMTAALDEVQAKLAGAYLAAGWFHGIDSRDLDQTMATWHSLGIFSFTPGTMLDGPAQAHPGVDGRHQKRVFMRCAGGSWGPGPGKGMHDR